MECKICRSPDPGNHFQQSCCRPCAAFFRRTIQLKIRYRCKRTGNCKITKDNRFFCRYCRMKRCIDAGMVSHENGDTPMDFYLDSSFLDQPNCSDQDILPSLDDDDIFSPENIFDNYDNFAVEFKQRLYDVLSKTPESSSFPFNLTLYQQATMAYKEHAKKWPNCTKERIVNKEVFDLNASFIDTYKEFQYIAEFCMDFHEFAKLPLDEKSVMIKRYCSQFIHFDRFYCTVKLLGKDLKDTRSVYYNGHAIDARTVPVDASKVSDSSEDQLRRMINRSEDLFVSVLLEFKKLDPDHFELMYMLLASLWNIQGKEGISKETLEIAQEIQERLSEELYFYYKYEKRISNFAARVYKIHNLFSAIDRIDELRKQDSQVAKTFDLFTFDVHFDNFTNG